MGLGTRWAPRLGETNWHAHWGASIPAALALHRFGPVRTICGTSWQADKTLKLAREHSFGITEIWIQVLFICSHFMWGLVMVMVLDLYFHANGSPAGPKFGRLARVQLLCNVLEGTGFLL